jgi:L-rhamnose-H+ transport protein
MSAFYGIALISLGSVCAASFYIPFKKVKNWAWESYWLAQGIAAWLIAPWFFAWFTIPNGELLSIIHQIPGETLLLTTFFGLLWGIGGLTFGLSIRYLGVALGQSIALGLCAAFGTLIPPLVAGDNLFGSPAGLLTLLGVALCLAGIVIIGFAGSLKNKGLSDSQRKEAVKEFALKKGLIIAILAGAMSACFNFGYQSGRSIELIAQQHGTDPLYLKNVSLIFILFGGFITNLVYCVWLNIRNKTYKDYITSSPSVLANNIFFTFLAGILWFLQFHLYGMGSSKLPQAMVIFGWSILMALNIAISNIWGIALKEWKGSNKKTMLVLLLGIVILILSTFVVSLN